MGELSRLASSCVHVGRVFYERFADHLRARMMDEQKRNGHGVLPSDLRLQVRDRLRREPNLDTSDIAVKVERSVIRLEGTVPEHWMKLHIEDIADYVAGVGVVETHIRVRRGTTPASRRGSGSTATPEHI